MTCLTPPTDLDSFLAVINRCATEYGGPNWPHAALLGLVALSLTLLGIVLLLLAVRRD